MLIDIIVLGFELAVDLDDYDLFIDVHHAAEKRQHHDLAQVKDSPAQQHLVRLKGSYGTTILLR